MQSVCCCCQTQILLNDESHLCRYGIGEDQTFELNPLHDEIDECLDRSNNGKGVSRCVRLLRILQSESFGAACSCVTAFTTPTRNFSTRFRKMCSSLSRWKVDYDFEGIVRSERDSVRRKCECLRPARRRSQGQIAVPHDEFLSEGVRFCGRVQGVVLILCFRQGSDAFHVETRFLAYSYEFGINHTMHSDNRKPNLLELTPITKQKCCRPPRDRCATKGFIESCPSVLCLVFMHINIDCGEIECTCCDGCR